MITGLELMFLLLAMPSYPIPWRRCAPPVVLILLALAWLPLVAAARSWLLNPGTALPVALDLFLPKYLSTLAAVWALLIGIISARLAVRTAPQVALLTASATVHAAAGLIAWEWSLTSGARFGGLIGNANVTACVCGAACVLAWSGLLAGMRAAASHDKKTAILIGATIALAINLLALILTASRVPSILTIIAVGGIGLLHWPGRLRGFVACLALAATVILVAQSQLVTPLANRIELVGSDAESRWAMWSHFARAVQPALWTGYGSGSFPSLNSYMLTIDMAAQDIGRVNSPHNLVLQLLLVGGLPYFLLLTTAAGLILRDITRADRWRSDAGFCALALASLVILLSGSVDIALDVPASTILFALMAGATWSYALTPVPVRATAETPRGRRGTISRG